MIRHLASAENGMWVNGGLHKSTALHQKYTNGLKLWMQEHPNGSYEQFQSYARWLSARTFR